LVWLLYISFLVLISLEWYEFIHLSPTWKVCIVSVRSHHRSFSVLLCGRNSLNYAFDFNQLVAHHGFSSPSVLLCGRNFLNYAFDFSQLDA
jgi:hypothetical protein